MAGYPWGAPHDRAPVWSPFAPFLHAAYGSPFLSPYASPYASPYHPAAGLASPYASPAGLASPYASPYGSPFPTPGLFSPGPSPAAAPVLPPEASPPAGTPAVQVAPWLAAAPPSASSSLATWDVRTPPTDATFPGERGPRPLSAQFGEQATYPASAPDTPLLFDGCALLAKLYPDGARVAPAAASVEAVLRAAHDFLQTRMTRDEVEVVRAHADGAWEALVQAMAARCRASRQLAEVEWAQGLRRVDVLGATRAFAGVRVEYEDDGTWRLRLLLADVPKTP